MGDKLFHSARFPFQIRKPRAAVEKNSDNAVVAAHRTLVNVVVGIFPTDSIQIVSTDRLMMCFRALFMESR